MGATVLEVRRARKPPAKDCEIRRRHEARDVAERAGDGSKAVRARRCPGGRGNRSARPSGCPGWSSPRMTCTASKAGENARRSLAPPAGADSRIELAHLSLVPAHPAAPAADNNE